MKTKTQLLNEIEKIAEKEKITTKDKNKVSFYRQCIRYLDTEPSEEFVQKSLDEVNHRLKVIEDRYEVWLDSPHHKTNINPRGMYYTEMGRNQLKKQQETLNFLLR